MKRVKTVKVDFSSGLRGGLVRASQRRASEPLKVGDRVQAVDPAEDMEFIGTVERLDDGGSVAFLRMEWEDDDGATANSPVTAIFDLENLFRDTEFEPFMLSAQVEPDRSHYLATSVLVAFNAPENITAVLFGGSHVDEDESTDLYRRVMLAR